MKMKMMMMMMMMMIEPSPPRRPLGGRPSASAAGGPLEAPLPTPQEARLPTPRARETSGNGGSIILPPTSCLHGSEIMVLLCFQKWASVNPSLTPFGGGPEEPVRGDFGDGDQVHAPPLAVARPLPERVQQIVRQRLALLAVAGPHLLRHLHGALRMIIIGNVIMIRLERIPESVCNVGITSV
jgi:hypothetical protein